MTPKAVKHLRFLPVAALLTVAWPSRAQAPAPHYVTASGSLHGVRSIVVAQPDMTLDAKSADTLARGGVTAHRLQTDVELRLREAGVTVTPQAQADTAVLQVHLTTVKEDGAVAYALHFELKQRAVLERDPAALVVASTWQRTVVGHTGDTRLDAIRSNANDLTSDFVNDYLAANPKPVGLAHR